MDFIIDLLKVLAVMMAAYVAFAMFVFIVTVPQQLRRIATALEILTVIKHGEDI